MGSEDRTGDDDISHQLSFEAMRRRRWWLFAWLLLIIRFPVCLAQGDRGLDCDGGGVRDSGRGGSSLLQFLQSLCSGYRNRMPTYSIYSTQTQELGGGCSRAWPFIRAAGLTLKHSTLDTRQRGREDSTVSLEPIYAIGLPIQTIAKHLSSVLLYRGGQRRATRINGKDYGASRSSPRRRLEGWRVREKQLCNATALQSSYPTSLMLRLCLPLAVYCITTAVLPVADKAATVGRRHPQINDQVWVLSKDGEALKVEQLGSPGSELEQSDTLASKLCEVSVA
nr:hypothetical protein CFP56_41465 [Quercus suber]